MAISAGQINVTTTAQEISGHSVSSSKVTIMNHEHGAGKQVWLGGSGVTINTGMLLGAEPLTFELFAMEHIHAVTDSGTVKIGYIRQV